MYLLVSDHVRMHSLASHGSSIAQVNGSLLSNTTTRHNTTSLRGPVDVGRLSLLDVVFRGHVWPLFTFVFLPFCAIRITWFSAESL